MTSKLPVSPTPSHRGDLNDRLDARIEREKKIEDELANPRGSRLARGCSGIIALMGMVPFGLILALGLRELFRGDVGSGLLLFAVGLPFFFGIGWVGVRWLRGLGPTRLPVSDKKLLERIREGREETPREG